MSASTPIRDADLEKVLACRYCGYPFICVFKHGREIRQGLGAGEGKKIDCPDCGRTYVCDKKNSSYHADGDPPERMNWIGAEKWRKEWRRPPRVLLDTVDSWGIHVWMRVSRNLVDVIEHEPAETFSILASQRPGAFDPGRVRFVCWHRDDFAPDEYRIAELLVAGGSSREAED